ncbi:hypothetical protein QBC46DRAFT_418945 [Diplogelasinospora grovesii]|uniref:DUF8206 domain-containing protein n=1 Tax=Diplogelasinospora grovesii TaxID=303347 RepID=A0AAN6NDC1_9PEZI|nr:hypothetical protein QBC46DRAFT_418945 [Diplogelasinospora grovesii]
MNPIEELPTALRFSENKNLIDLEGKSLLRCGDPGNLDRSINVVPPPGRRLVRVPCPGTNCFNTGKFEWMCPTCREMVCYGHKDGTGTLNDWLYCGCGRYSPSNAVFKCQNPAHGLKRAKYPRADELRALLAALQPSEEFNILILGETGVGKSTFINGFLNYMLFDTLGDAMAADDFRWVIPTSFTYRDDFVQVGEETEREKDSKRGQSATQSTVPYVFNLKGKVFRLIDTPGIGDTRGIAQDHENVKDILKELESVDRISTILFLLKPNSARLTTTFNFCMTELLSHLHRDTSKNIVFGFTNSRASNFELGDTKVPLEALLRERQVDITLGIGNTFFFDSESFRFLALYKMKGKEMSGRDSFEYSWNKSVEATRRLINESTKLPVHKVSDTLQMNRTRLFITNMTKPMIQTAKALKLTLSRWSANKEEFGRLNSKDKDLKGRLKIWITVPVRKDLDYPKTVCADEKCFRIETTHTGEKVKLYDKVCHKKCSVKTPDEIIGTADLARHRLHTVRARMEKHLHVSYDVELEQKEVPDEGVTKQLGDIKSRTKAIDGTIENLVRHIIQVKQEEMQVKEALAMFGVYLKRNALVAYNDATIAYLDYLIADAQSKGGTDEVQQLGLQKIAYQDQLTSITNAIKNGKTDPPDEKTLDDTINKLYKMPNFGPDLAKVLPRGSVIPSMPRAPVYVSWGSKSGSKCFNWLL